MNQEVTEHLREEAKKVDEALCEAVLGSTFTKPLEGDAIDMKEVLCTYSRSLKPIAVVHGEVLTIDDPCAWFGR